jgi:hypothetical protein
MKAFIYDKYGPPRTLCVPEGGKPAPDAGEVLVKVLAISVTAADRHSMRGKPLFSRATLGLPARGRWSWKWHEGLPVARMGRRQEDWVWALLPWASGRSQVTIRCHG